MPLIVEEFRASVFKSLATPPFELDKNVFRLSLPTGAKILSCRLYSPTSTLSIFAEVDTDEAGITDREFAIVENGKGLPEAEHSGWVFMETIDHFLLNTYHIYLRVV